MEYTPDTGSGYSPAENPEEQEDQLKKLLYKIEKRRDACVKAKEQVEIRWAEDLNQYEGNDRIRNSKQFSTTTESAAGRPPKANITRARTNAIAASIRDMMFPGNDRNFELTDPLDEDGPTGQEDPNQLLADREAAKKAAMEMQKIIDGQLKESDFSENGRRMIEDACQIGTGIMKGPVVVSRKRHKFTQITGDTGPVMKWGTEYKNRPGCLYVNPRFVYTDANRDFSDATVVFELHLMNRAQIRQLMNQPGFKNENIQKLLNIKPDLGQVGHNLARWNQSTDLREETDGKYAVWEMHGILSDDEAKCLGMDTDGMTELPLVQLWFSQCIPLKTKFSALEQDNRVPYYGFCYERADDSPWGYGVPYLYAPAQRSIDAAWAIVLHNASVSSGAQILYRDGKVNPVDGKYEIRGPKLWRVKDDETKMDDVFQSFIPDNNVQQALAILDRAIALGDEVIQFQSTIGSGEANRSTETAAGLVIEKNAENIVQRRSAKSIDDDLLTPMIERFVWYNMANHPNFLIKRDFTVQALGTSVLLQKELKTQHLQVFTQVSGDPRFAPYVNNYKLLSENVQVMDVRVDGLIKTEQEVQQEMEAQPPQQDPAVMTAEARMKEADVRIQEMQQNTVLAQAKFEAEKADKERDDEFRQNDRVLDHQERMAEIQAKREEAQARVLIAQLQNQADLLKLAQNKEVDFAKIQKDLHVAELNTQLTEFTATMNARIQAEKVANADREISLKLNPANQSREGI